jgi:divalent metal cation (Fe/Co/Zn/Cd) transporter
MKKVLGIATGSLATLAAALPAFAQANINPCPTGIGGQICSIQPDQFGSIVSNVITILIIVAVIIAVVFLIWGGIQWILSGGDKSKVESARNSIIGAIIGLVIVFLAYFIISVVANAFGVSITNLTLPKIL